jgi:CheY-like chemotaxis protein
MISTRNVPMQLHPRCTENRTEGFGCAPMPADHLADVFRMDAQLKNDHLLPLDRTNLHLFGMRILIVDDSEITRRILGTIVRSRRWTVCGEAENGWSGVTKFQELKPDVVLLDLAMPDINGIEAAKQMSASDPRVSLILFTIYEIEGIESAAREAGIRAVVPKTKAWNLIGSIESLVNRKSNPQVH